MLQASQLKCLIGGACMVLLLAGCEQKNTYVEPPAPKVTVATPMMDEVTDYLEFTGTLVATERADVRARVSGVLQSMHFTPGADVDKGDLLFVIDPAEYEADLQAAKAELAGAKSNFDRASTEYQRSQKLFKQKAGAEAEVVKWRVEKEIASAEILRAEAKVDRAELNLGYTQVLAPLTGRVGRNEVDLGNLVGESEATILTNITRYDPIYVYFSLNERDLLRVLKIYRRNLEKQSADPTDRSFDNMGVPLALGLADEEDFPHQGHLDYSESEVDAETGTIELRGIFDNPGAVPVLLPGLFTRLRMPLGTRPDMPLVSERALNQDQSGIYLVVVDSGNVVERRSVKVGQRIDGMIVIEEGLGKDDRVVVDGVQRARPGRKVDPQQVDMASLTLSARRAALAEAEAAAAADAPDQTEQPD